MENKAMVQEAEQSASGNNKEQLWVIDPAHTEVLFRVKHMVITTLGGKFDKFEGKIYSSSGDFSNSRAEFTADINSINTGNTDRDNHLKSPDFFDAANHPKLTFKSTSWEKVGDDEFKMQGDLTIRGTTKKIDLKVEFTGIIEDAYGNTRAGFELSGKISRKEYGLLWNMVTEAGGVVVADEIKMQVNAEVIRQ
ncbi:MAG: YceI family protein [Syntrophothermus sp.]